MSITREIKITPIPEKYWWKGEGEKSITHLPITEWKLEYTPPTTEKDRWIDSNSNNDFIGWPWWKVEGDEINLFLNVSLGLIGVEGSQVDSDEILTFILDTLGKDNLRLRFIPTLGKDWEEELIPEEYLCNVNNRNIIQPQLNLGEIYLSRYNDSSIDIKDKEKLIQFLEKEEGTHIWKYKGEEILRYDCKVEDEYGYLKSRIGIPEKMNSTSTKFSMVKKISFIKSLIQEKRKEWIKLLNSLSKK